jgi:hypothetical protein
MKSIKQSLREYNRQVDRDFAREEEHFDEHGSYSACAGCGEECNPSNVHASGKKYCDDCWHQSDGEYELSPEEQQQWEKQSAAADFKLWKSADDKIKTGRLIELNQKIAEFDAVWIAGRDKETIVATPEKFAELLGIKFSPGSGHAKLVEKFSRPFSLERISKYARKILGAMEMNIWEIPNEDEWRDNQNWSECDVKTHQEFWMGLLRVAFSKEQAHCFFEATKLRIEKQDLEFNHKYYGEKIAKAKAKGLL